MIEQPEQRLFLAAKMTVEGPGEKALAAVQQAEIGPHARNAPGAVIAPATGLELVEPDGRLQRAAHLHGLVGTADGVTRIVAEGAVVGVGPVAGEIVEAASPRPWPQIGQGRCLRHVFPTHGVEAGQEIDRLIRPEAAQIQIPFKRTRAVAIGQLHLVP